MVSLEGSARTHSTVCLNGGCEEAIPVRQQLTQAGFEVRPSGLARHVPGMALLLRRAGARQYRYGACAFSTLEGYAGRNRETELAFPACCGKTPSHRPGFRLKWERRQTRSSNDRVSARALSPESWGLNARQALGDGVRQAGLGWQGFLKGKEFQVAYIQSVGSQGAYGPSV